MAHEKLPALRVEGMIHVLRGQRVMLSTDLAGLYGVESKALIQAVNRNKERFPSDFMFRLTRPEIRDRSQFVTCGRIYRARNVLAFTEQGVAMLSSVLRSERAVQVNIAIMRTFVKLRETIETHHELAAKFAELEKRVAKHDEGIGTLFEAIRRLMTPPEGSPKRIGFHVRERRAKYAHRK